jgi:hypothetical protein
VVKFLLEQNMPRFRWIGEDFGGGENPLEQNGFGDDSEDDPIYEAAKSLSSNPNEFPPLSPDLSQDQLSQGRPYP